MRYQLAKVCMLITFVTIIFALPLCAKAETSGTCGDKLTWLLDDEGTLTISGSGAMPDYTFPWGTNVKSVVIHEGVTSIGAFAFIDCASLSSVTIPNSVVSINAGAFANCPSIKQVYIDSLSAWIEIDFSDETSTPLRYCVGNLYLNGEAVTDIVIPQGVTKIGDYAFYGCSSISSVHIPSSLVSIGTDAFGECINLQKVHIASLNAWLAINFRSYPLSYGATLYLDGKELTEVVIPQGTESIGAYSFYNYTHLAGVTIPDGVTNIGNFAFAGCSNLKSVKISNGVKNIGNSAFAGCSNLKSMVIPNSVSSIGRSAFSNCNTLTSIMLPNSISSIKEATFSHTGLTSISIPQGVAIIEQKAFEGCRNLTNVTLPDSVNYIDGYVFYDCRSLTSVTIPQSVKHIWDNTFYRCSSLTSVTLPSEMAQIESYAFSGSTNISCVFITGDQRPAYTLPTSLSRATIYCNEFSEVDFWATENGYKVAYLEQLDVNTPLEFTLECPADSLLVGQSIVILPTVVFVQNELPIEWSSSNPDVASVENGQVTALAAGQVTITATCGKSCDSIKLTIYAPVESFRLVPNELWLIAKTTLKITISDIQPAGAVCNFTVSSSDNSTAKIVITENVISIQALRPGDMVLTVTEVGSNLQQECIVHVFYPVTGISFAENEIKLATGTTTRLAATVTCSASTNASTVQTAINKLVTFTSTDESVAVVDTNGCVTAVGVGSATIAAASDNGRSASCTVTVVELTRSLLPSSLTIIEDGAFAGTNVTYCVLPEGLITIGAQAFANCTDLMRVDIPATVTSIAADAFDGCVDLTIIAPQGSKAHEFAVANGFAWAAP